MKWPFFTAFLALLGASNLQAAEPGDQVVVVFNSRLPDSKAVAAHYAAVRHVPPRQVLGLDLPIGENMTRRQFRDELQTPLLNFLVEKSFFVFDPAFKTPDALPLQTHLLRAGIRYLVLAYGVPLRILEDPALAEPDEAGLQPEFRGRNGAAVDSELVLLPWVRQNIKLNGPWRNFCFAATNAASINPVNGALIVARLDGPTPAVAMKLVDKALEAETNGLWGRAYFDLRGITNGSYKMGDDWLRGASESARRYGFETVVDDLPETFPAAFPMSQIALYAGWYDGNVSGPFTRPNVEFMPGAFAYHLHSFSAHTLRSTNQNWCGPLLAAGATATMGCVDEPFLGGTPDIDVFVRRWLYGFTYGEAACAAQQVVSWQTTVVGDPLYRPFAQTPRALHDQLVARRSPLLQWSVLRAVDMNLASGALPNRFIPFLETEPVTRQSAVLTEKLAQLYQDTGQKDLAIQALRLALALNPTPQTAVRLTMNLGDALAASGQEDDALKVFDTFQKAAPDYPGALALWQKMQALAARTGNKNEQTRCAAEIKKLSSPINP